MKNLFQNKKILLFTLILMASCLGILGVTGEIFAYDYRCDNNNITYGGSTINNGRTANDLCAGGIWGDDCDDEGDYDYAFCVENNQKSVRFGCKKVSLWCSCNPDLFEVDDCPNGCANGKCKTSSTLPAATKTCAGKGGVCCNLDENDCNNFISGVSSSCPGSNNYCCKTESCVLKTTTGCVCNYGNYKDTDPPECGISAGCNDGQILQKRTKSPTAACGSNDCKNTTQCKRDVIKCPTETTTPASIVPVIPQSTSTGGEIPIGGDTQKPPVAGGAVTFINPLSTNSFEALIMGIINWILGIVVSLAILFLIIGGLMYITSAGDEERIKKAKNIILYAVVGLGVVILSWSIITELKDILGVQ